MIYIAFIATVISILLISQLIAIYKREKFLNLLITDDNKLRNIFANKEYVIEINEEAKNPMLQSHCQTLFEVVCKADRLASIKVGVLYLFITIGLLTFSYSENQNYPYVAVVLGFLLGMRQLPKQAVNSALKHYRKITVILLNWTTEDSVGLTKWLANNKRYNNLVKNIKETWGLV